MNNQKLPPFTNQFHIDYMKDDAIQQGLFKDSLSLRTKEFYNVYTAPGLCYLSDSLYVDTLFYTEIQGLVGLKLSDGKFIGKRITVTGWFGFQ